MTCRHAAGDPDCSSSPEGRIREAAEARLRRTRELEERTPDPDRYEIEDVLRVGAHLVLKVKYPSCAKCAFEGSKVMVFLNAPEAVVLRWRRIDPHFRDPKARSKPNEAPSPVARYPATKEGWEDAVAYAKYKDSQKASA